MARGSSDVGYLASPVSGGGIDVSRIQQLFLLAKTQGKTQPADWAAFAWSILSSQNQKIVKDGLELATADENLVEISRLAAAFAERRLPILNALGIA